MVCYIAISNSYTPRRLRNPRDRDQRRTDIATFNCCDIVAYYFGPIPLSSLIKEGEVIRNRGQIVPLTLLESMPKEKSYLEEEFLSN